MFIFSISCNRKNIPNESDEITNAKWYYYSYVIDLTAYDKSGAEIQPLACDIKLLRILKINTDTTKIYFEASNKDTLNVCSFKPLDLVGINVVKNKLYLPIYHTIVFDRESDTIILEKMNKQNVLLQGRILNYERNINPWLMAEAKSRNVLK
jgi:hypothetical protein